MDLKEAITSIDTNKDVNASRKAFTKLCNSLSEEDLPILYEIIQSNKLGFSTREWLAEPIIKIAGIKSIPVLMKALRINFENGHDNDSLQGLLTKLAKDNPLEVKNELEKIRNNAREEELEDIIWLEEYCAQVK